TMWRSVRQTAQAWTLTSTRPGPGAGTGSSRLTSGVRAASRTIARMVVGMGAGSGASWLFMWGIVPDAERPPSNSGRGSTRRSIFVAIGVDPRQQFAVLHEVTHAEVVVGNAPSRVRAEPGSEDGVEEHAPHRVTECRQIRRVDEQTVLAV